MTETRFPLVNPPPEPETDLQKAERMLGGMVVTYMALAREANPKLTALEGACEVLDMVAGQIEANMPREALMRALLVTYEACHENPMSFIDRNKAKDALEHISNVRRRQDAEMAKVIDIHGNTLIKGN